MKAAIYPNLLYSKGANPYIEDFVTALRASGIQVTNSPHKNPLYSICFKRINCDFYFFHWIEDIANHKFGYLQALMAIVFIMRIRWHKKKIIWFLHNRESHATRHKRVRKIMIKMLAKYSSHIITHASGGMALIQSPLNRKVVFIDHPTKNRMEAIDQSRVTPPAFDLLIWGTISRYKGVLEFLQFNKETHSSLRINIVGKCNDEQLLGELQEAKTNDVHIENRSSSFEELYGYIQDAKFVLIPYHSASILSSGILMDSLSFGAKVIGPNAGSFKDYASSTKINVYTFEQFEEIEHIVSTNTATISRSGYHDFLQRNSWDNFMRKMLDVIV